MPASPGPSLPDPRIAGATWLTAPETLRVMDAIGASGFEVRAVGGAVRNTLLGEPVSDVDLATDAPPQTVIDLCRAAGLHVIPTGLAHGTVTVIANHVPFEVTTLRRDVATDGRRATIAYTADWVQDARRRDFTINAIYADRQGRLLDPVGGLADIDPPRIRFIGDAGERIGEDYLRILRFFRFSARYTGGALDRDGLAACLEHREGLSRLSAERINTEFMKLLEAPAAAIVVAEMEKWGLVSDLLGGSVDVASFARWTQIAADIPEPWRAGTDAVIGLGVLATVTEADAARLKGRLRLSNLDTMRLRDVMRAADAMAAPGRGASEAGIIYRCGVDAYRDAAILLAARNADRQAAHLLSGRLERLACWSHPRFPVGGGDVLARGVPAGPGISVVLQRLESWWIDAGFPDDRPRLLAELDALIEVTKR